MKLYPIILVFFAVYLSSCTAPPPNDDITEEEFQNELKELLKRTNLTEYYLRFGSDTLFSDATKRKYIAEFKKKRSISTQKGRYPFVPTLRAFPYIKLVYGDASKKKFEECFAIEDYTDIKPLPLITNMSLDTFYRYPSDFTRGKYYWYSFPAKNKATIAFFRLMGPSIESVDHFLSRNNNGNVLGYTTLMGLIGTMHYVSEQRVSKINLKLKMESPNDIRPSHEDSMIVYNYLKDTSIDFRPFLSLVDTLNYKGKYWKKNAPLVEATLKKLFKSDNFELIFSDDLHGGLVDEYYARFRIDTLNSSFLDDDQFESNRLYINHKTYIGSGDKKVPLLYEYKLTLNRRYKLPD